MRTSRHAFHRRTLLCIGLGLALLGHLPLAVASGSAALPFQTFMQTVTGNSTTVGFTGSGTAVVARAPTALGGSAGWTYASNFGISAGTSGGYNLATAGDIAVGKHSVPVNLVGQASKAAAARSAAATVLSIGRAGAGPLGLLWTAASIYDLLQVNGIGKNTDPATNVAQPFLVKKSVNEMGYRVNSTMPWSRSKSEACGAWAAKESYNDGYGAVRSASVQSTTPGCKIKITVKISGDPTVGTEYRTAYYEDSVTEFLKDFPASMDDIKPYMIEEVSPAKLPTFIDETERIRKLFPNAGIEPFKLEFDQAEKVTGPATLPAAQPVVKTTTTPRTDGGTVTTTTSSTTQPKLVYNDNKVTATEQTTTTSITDAPDVETKPAEQETELCKLNPDIIACAKTDSPEEEIPKSTKELTYSEDTMFSGGGSCPADKVMTLHTGQTVKVWDWQQGCSWIVTYVRPILLVVASYIAVMMLVPKT